VWKDGDPGSADDIFLGLLKDRMVDATTILQDLDGEIGTTFANGKAGYPSVRCGIS
jgi:hypothetical protein